ncbi:protein LAZ1, partial [Tanacetum coccineum]
MSQPKNLLKLLNSKLGDLATKFISIDGKPMMARRSVTDTQPSRVESVKLNVEQPSQHDMKSSSATVVSAEKESTSDASPERPPSKINFRTLFNEEKVEDTDLVLPMDSILTMQRSTPIILHKWSPNLSFSKDEVKKVPVWVKMHKVPVVSYSEDGLSLIASQISTPIMLDAFTTSMCADPWGRIRHAPALIEVSADKELKQIVKMVVPVVEGEGYTKEQIKVEYEWHSPTCHDCHVFGHTMESCPKRPVEVVKEKEKEQVQEDGFTIVSNKKKKGKKKNNGQPKLIKGLKFNKPKTTFVYQPKGSQSLNSKAIEKDPILNLKNPFETLSQQDDLVRASKAGECSGGNGDDRDRGDQLESLDTDSEVEEVYVEPMPKLESLDTDSEVEEVYVEPMPKNQLSVCAILESHMDVSTLSNICSKVFKFWEWTSNVSLCAKGYRIILGWDSEVLMGDYNVALNLEDSHSGSSRLNFAMIEFKDCVSQIKVMDINCSGIHFTWNQKPRGEGGLLKKLDRIMGNLEFLRKLIHDQGNLHDRVNKLRHELDEVQKALDLNPTVSVLREEEAVYVHAFNEAKLDEGRFLKQKAKVEWLQVGDSNSAYFYKSVKSRNQRCRIKVIKDEQNVIFSGPVVPSAFVSHYEMFLSSAMACTNLNLEGLFTSKVSESSYLNMVRHVSDLEIKEAMFSIGDDRAPGPNEYTSAFFKKGWDIVGVDVCKAIRDFFVNGQILKEINHTFIALIPKVSTHLKINDYCPISCYNVIYKCISKIITNHIIDGIKEVASNNQSAFVPGRRIFDNILITHELMHNYHRNRGPPGCAFKVDIQKAYDTVDWVFLGNILMCFGFHPIMIKWIMACVSSTSFSICINGDVHGFFKGKRGLRQGDLMSPYLFMLVMKVLTLMLKRRVRESDSFRYHNHCEELQIINVCFVDDLFMFDRGDVESARGIMESLDEFKLTSGLVPSIHKSTAFFCNVLNHVKIAILNIMPFSEGELPIKYLGVPLISSRLLNKDCKVLVVKAKNRIGYWKNKSLSFAGRLQLFLSPREISNAGYNTCSKVSDLMVHNAWNWPSSWLIKAPELGLVPTPSIQMDTSDVLQWRDSNE